PSEETRGPGQPAPCRLQQPRAAAATRFRLGLSDSDVCPDCGARDTEQQHPVWLPKRVRGPRPASKMPFWRRENDQYKRLQTIEQQPSFGGAGHQRDPAVVFFPRCPCLFRDRHDVRDSPLGGCTGAPASTWEATQRSRAPLPPGDYRANSTTSPPQLESGVSSGSEKLVGSGDAGAFTMPAKKSRNSFLRSSGGVTDADSVPRAFCTAWPSLPECACLMVGSLCQTGCDFCACRISGTVLLAQSKRKQTRASCMFRPAKNESLKLSFQNALAMSDVDSLEKEISEFHINRDLISGTFVAQSPVHRPSHPLTYSDRIYVLVRSKTGEQIGDVQYLEKPTIEEDLVKLKDEDRENDELISSTCEFLRHGIDINRLARTERELVSGLADAGAIDSFLPIIIYVIDSNSGITIAIEEEKGRARLLKLQRLGYISRTKPETHATSSFASRVGEVRRFRRKKELMIKKNKLDPEALKEMENSKWVRRFEEVKTRILKINFENLIVSSGGGLRRIQSEILTLFMDKATNIKESNLRKKKALYQIKSLEQEIHQQSKSIVRKNRDELLRQAGLFFAEKKAAHSRRSSVSKENLVDCLITSLNGGSKTSTGSSSKKSRHRNSWSKKSMKLTEKERSDIKALYPRVARLHLLTMDVTSKYKFRGFRIDTEGKLRSAAQCDIAFEHPNLVHVVGVRLHKTRPEENWYTVEIYMELTALRRLDSDAALQPARKTALGRSAYGLRRLCSFFTPARLVHQDVALSNVWV
uniref:Protein kinase domain-containing protein n=1 Tax=Macrostomum lignano TaxID=282301 RepID=A0A1I8JN19_9PLAT